MIYVVISDISSVDLELSKGKEEEISYLKELISHTKNAEKKKERVGEYLTLLGVYKELFEKELPGITETDTGKPVFMEAKNPISFNISGEGNCIAIALTDEETRKVGIDLVSICSRVEKKGIEERFIGKLDFSLICDTGADIRLYYSKLKENGELEFLTRIYPDGKNTGDLKVCTIGNILTEEKEGSENGTLPYPVSTVCLERVNNSLTNFENADTLLKWSMLESVLKCDGRGFGAFTEANKLFAISRIASYKVKACDSEYYLSVSLLIK